MRKILLIVLLSCSSAFAQVPAQKCELYWQAPPEAIVMLNGDRIESEEIIPARRYAPYNMNVCKATVELKVADVLGVICHTDINRSVHLLMAVMKDGQPLLGTNARSWYYRDRSPDTFFWTSPMTMGAKRANKSTHARNEAIMQFYSTIGATPTHIEPIHGDTKRISYFKCLIQPLDLQSNIRR